MTGESIQKQAMDLTIEWNRIEVHLNQRIEEIPEGVEFGKLLRERTKICTVKGVEFDADIIFKCGGLKVAEARGFPEGCFNEKGKDNYFL